MLLADEFWQYSLRVYGQEEVKNQCLLLQNDYSLNVNMLLLCGFLSKQNFYASIDMLKKLSKEVENIDQQLRKMRIKRNACKLLQPKLYKSLLAEELLLEKSQQAVLILELNRLVNDGTLDVEENKDNFINYYQSLAIDNKCTVNQIENIKALIVNA